MRCQHRPLVLCKAFQREKVSVRAFGVISASTNGDVTPRINCELPKLGVTAAENTKKGRQSLRASLGLKLMCEAEKATAVKQRCNALVTGKRSHFCNLTRTAIQ